MPLLIDCYNVMGVAMPQELAGLDERGLCHALAASVFGRQKATLVCDGAVKPGGPEQSPVEGVDIIYAGSGKSADPVIIRFAKEYSAPKRLLVVTSDHAIQKAVKRRKCRVMESADFVKVLARGRRTMHPGHDDPGTRDPGILSEGQVERWLDDFGVDGDERLGSEGGWRDFVDD